MPSFHLDLIKITHWLFTVNKSISWYFDGFEYPFQHDSLPFRIIKVSIVGTKSGLDKISIDGETAASLKISDQREFSLVTGTVILVVVFGFLAQHFGKVVMTY